ncbi:MAG TPA: hypothetical protein ENI38_01370 [Candidatus Acetothermia bacterium]|nr:hypothetical protein [Candidatus Acetothermia bacterium]
MAKKLGFLLLAVGLMSSLSGGAGCDCQDTCHQVTGCNRLGWGECSYVSLNRNHQGQLGQWGWWQADLMEYCRWENYQCEAGKSCEHVTTWLELGLVG